MAAHIVYLILESKQKNDLFRSPMSENAQNILDLGTDNGDWCRIVVDKFPTVVTALYAEVDLIHLRDLHGSFTDKQWTGVYKQAYENLLPGGWIEAVDAGVCYYCVDGALPKDSLLATSGDLWDRSAEKICKSMDTIFKTKARVEAAFTNITAVWYKIRFQSMIGPRAYFSRRLEDSRRRKCWRLGGVFDVCSDTHGAPGPWTPEEAHVWVAKMRKEICNPAYHAYCLKRRVYAQKPLDG